MRALKAILLSALLASAASAAILPGRLGIGFFAPPSGGGATLLINCPTFGGTGCNSSAITTAGNVAFSGSQLQMTTGVSHEGGAAWYGTTENIQSFTTTFTFNVAGQNGYGVLFAITNANSTTNPGFPTSGYGSANGMGYGAGGGSSQPATGNSVALLFNASGFNSLQSSWYQMPVFTAVGLYVDGGPAIGGSGPANGFAAQDDLQSSGVNISANDLMSATVTYDGTILTLVLTDTVTGATARLAWPVNIPAVVGANTATVGFTSNTPSTGANYVSSWKWWQGINTELASPTFSPTPGQYTSTQSVSINCPSGASCYYSTNGRPPTASSTLYTGTPISVSASELLQAVAIESNFTDSPIALGNYQIQASATPIINFPSGFASAGGLIQPNGYATVSGGKINLTDTVQTEEVASAWYAAPVTVSTFNTTFTVDLTSASANGFCFVLQNYPQTTTGTNYNWTLGNGPYGVVTVSGGPFTLSSTQSNLAYTDIFASAAICFDLYNGSGDLTGLYTDGAVPTGSNIDMTSSGVSLHSGHPLQVNLNYNGTSLVETVTDTVTSSQFTHTYTVDIPSHLGASTGFAGFTASTGGATANISIASWTE